MKLLVTGGAGYVGSVCATVLLEQGHDITIVDNFSTGNRDAVPANATLIEGDIRDVAGDVLAGGNFDGVVHFAARSLVGESMERPEDYWHHNFVTTLTLLDAMRAHGVTNLVFSSTAATYGEPDRVPITEDMPTAPTNPYGASKLAIDYALTSYAHAHGLGATSLRYFNVAGAKPDGSIGEDHGPETHLLPIVLQVAQGKREKIAVFGDDYDTLDGTNVRDYVHPFDLADAHILAVEHLRAGHPSDAFNLGSSTGFSNLQIVEAARKVTGHPIPLEIAERRPGDPDTLIASSEKARKVLGWQPKFDNIETIIETAWKWHSSHPNGYDDRG